MSCSIPLDLQYNSTNQTNELGLFYYYCHNTTNKRSTHRSLDKDNMYTYYTSESNSNNEWHTLATKGLEPRV